MSALKRKVYGAVFKAKVGLEAVRGVKTINEIAQEHGVHPAQVGQWKKAIQDQASSLFDGKRGPQALDAHSEPERLYSEIGRLKVELDWLKKSGVSIQMRRFSYAKDLSVSAHAATAGLRGARRAALADLAQPFLALGWPRDRERTSGAWQPTAEEAGRRAFPWHAILCD